VTIENDFKKVLVEFTHLNKDFIRRTAKKETPVHLRLSPGCGISTVEEMVALINSLNYSFEYSDVYTRSPDYMGHGITVIWENNKIGMLLAVQQEGRIRRKELTPNNLGLKGSFNSVQVFESSILESIKNHIHYDFLSSLIFNIKLGTPICSTDIQRKDISRITSDFGEVLAAFASVCRGNVVSFPNTSNNTVIDFYENDVPVSVKNPKGGGKVNLSSYKDMIDTTTNVGKLLYSIADHNRDDFFKYGAKVSPIVNRLSKIVGGTSVDAVKKYVSVTNYSVFYDFIKSIKECRMLGIPKTEEAEKLWNSGSTEPFYFTLNTLLSRTWGRNPDNGVSNIVRLFLNKPKFVKVDILNSQVTFDELKFSNVEHWGTCYWGIATSAWNNWMGVSPLKDKND
jgi:hypothetical protein